MDNEILNYKDLAALPKIKSIYEVQRPDLISYEPYHRYTSDETLERYSYGEVPSLDTPNAALCWELGTDSGQWGKPHVVRSVQWDYWRGAGVGIRSLLEASHYWGEGLGWKGNLGAAAAEEERNQ